MVEGASVTLTWGDLGAVALMMVTVAGAICTWLRQVVTESREFRKAFEQRLEKVEEAVQRLVDDKADKDDFLRESMNARKVMGGIAEKVVRIESRLEAEFGMGAAMERVADCLTRILEKKP